MGALEGSQGSEVLFTLVPPFPPSEGFEGSALGVLWAMQTLGICNAVK